MTCGRRAGRRAPRAVSVRPSHARGHRRHARPVRHRRARRHAGGVGARRAPPRLARSSRTATAITRVVRASVVRDLAPREMWEGVPVAATWTCARCATTPGRGARCGDSVRAGQTLERRRVTIRSRASARARVGTAASAERRLDRPAAALRRRRAAAHRRRRRGVRAADVTAGQSGLGAAAHAQGRASRQPHIDVRRVRRALSAADRARERRTRATCSVIPRRRSSRRLDAPARDCSGPIATARSASRPTGACVRVRT